VEGESRRMGEWEKVKVVKEVEEIEEVEGRSLRNSALKSAKFCEKKDSLMVISLICYFVVSEQMLDIAITQ